MQVGSSDVLLGLTSSGSIYLHRPRTSEQLEPRTRYHPRLRYADRALRHSLSRYSGVDNGDSDVPQ